MELRGKFVLITGAARRIGREIALNLAGRGALILVHYRRSRSEAGRLKKEIEDLGAEAFPVAADFSLKNKPLLPRIRNFVNAIYQKVPRVDVLVNNAAIFYPTPFEKISEKDWDDFHAVNLKAPFFLAREIGMRMMKQGAGKIINLVDWTGLRPPARYLPYAISKAGLVAATRGLAKALAPHVHVNAIAPGPILPAEGSSKKEQKIIALKTLLKRFGDPCDIAETVRFLVEGGDFITGAVIPVDGGASIV